jgi:hypothetical protein
MIRKLLFFAFALHCTSTLHAQVAIAADPNPPHSKAMLDIRSGNKGILIPRMTTTSRLAIAAPIPVGLTVFDLNTMSYWYYFNEWQEIQTTAENPWTISGSTISNKDNRSLIIQGGNNHLGNIAFQAPNPTIYATSFLLIPGGANFNDRNVFFERTAYLRGGIINDRAPVLSIFGGTAAQTYFSGPVGILNNNPITPLDVLGGNWDLVNGEGDVRVGNSTYRLKIGVATGGGGAGAAGIMQYGAVGGLNVLTLGSQGNNVLYINGNNNAVGIHNSTPLFPLSFPNTTGGKISLYGNSTTQYYGIGIQNGQLQFHTDVNTSTIAFGYGSSDALTTRMRLHNSTGNLYIAGSLFSSYAFTPSDMTLKKDITPIEGGLEKLNQLNGYTYHWKNESSDPSLQSGVMAQEVEKVLPNLVQKTDNGTLAVNYDGLIPYLIQGVKEQQAEIDQLKKEVEELKEMVKKLAGKQ